MLDFLYRHINPVRLNLFWDSLKASLGIVLALGFALLLSDNPAHSKFAFIFCLQLVYAKSGISLKKRLPFTIFWSVCLGLALSIVPLVSGFLLLKSILILVVTFLTFRLKERFLIFNNNLANHFVLDFCVFLFLLPSGKFDPYFLLIAVICGVVSCFSDRLILNNKSFRIVKFNLLRTFLKIPLTLNKLSKKSKNLKRHKQKENYFFYLETINEIQELESVLIPEKKQKVFYTKLIFVTAATFRALKIIESNIHLCPSQFNACLSPVLEQYSQSYRRLAAYAFHKKVVIRQNCLQEIYQDFEQKYAKFPSQAQAKILVSLARLSSLATEIYQSLKDENQ